jgi:AcrR family transcriptional regulator
MSSKARRVREKAALKREILTAARDLFVQDGYENVSMRRIAEKIDYSPTTVYLHFVDKADLLFHICEETFAKLVAQGDKLLAQKMDPLAKLKMFGHTYIEFGLKHADHYKLTFMVQHEPDELEERFEKSMAHRAFEILRLCVQECIAKGVFRRIDLSQTSQALWAGVHGITSLLIARPDFPWTDRDQTIDLLIDSLCAGFSKGDRKMGEAKPARVLGQRTVSTPNSTTLN